MNSWFSCLHVSFVIIMMFCWKCYYMVHLRGSSVIALPNISTGLTSSHHHSLITIIIMLLVLMMMMVITYLIFVIFFTQAKFLENKIYTKKRVNYTVNCQFFVNYTVNCQFFALNLYKFTLGNFFLHRHRLWCL